MLFGSLWRLCPAMMGTTIHPKEVLVSFTFLFAIVSLLILIAIMAIAFIKKGWKTALISGIIAFVVLVAAFVLIITIIVNVMNGSPA